MRPPADAVVKTPEALARLSEEIVRCRRCPRLVRYRERLAVLGAEKDGSSYWGKPVPGFGDPEASVLVVGLAPAARGANRTGRIFTGDRSAEFLSAALYRAGFANQPFSVAREDGLEYRRAYLTAAVRCVPPDNRPTTTEADRCLPFLVREIRALPALRVVLGLGKLAWDRSFQAASEAFGVSLRRAPFTHGARLPLGTGLPVLWGTYHPSPRNTQTGLLSAEMFDRELTAIRTYVDDAIRGSDSRSRTTSRS